MASNYPGTIQTFTNPAGTNTLDSPSHADQHIVENDTLLNIQNTLGTTAGSALFTAFTLSDKPEKKGVITVGTTAYVTSGSLTSNQFLQYNGTNIVGGTAAAGGSSPLTTKGDLYTYGTADTRLPVGTTDGMVLMAASGSATGLAWATASAASIIRNEIPSGSINGTNTVFTLVATPLTNSLNLFQNGVLLLDGTADYSLSANTITFIGTPVTGDKLKADYIINSGYFAVGAASFVKETPSGTPNGTLTAFTLTGTPVTNSEFIYQDGQLLTGGSADYSMANGTINFIDPPLVNSVLTASYQANASVAGNADMVDGLHAADLTGTGWIINETPSGTVNGSNAAFDTASTYVSGSIQVYRDGQLMAGGGADYTETDSNTITFTTAPVTGSVLRVTYQHATSGTMNADTLDGQHAPTGTIVGNTDTQTLTNKTLTAPIINGAITGDALATGTTINTAIENDAIVTALAIAGSTLMKTSHTRFKIGTISRVQNADDAAVAYTGVGFQPSMIIFLANIGSAVGQSIGFDNGTTHYCMFTNTAGTQLNTNSYCIYRGDGVSWNESGSVTALGADGFTITWSKGGTPAAGTINIFYLAFI